MQRIADIIYRVVTGLAVLVLVLLVAVLILGAFT